MIQKCGKILMVCFCAVCLLLAAGCGKTENQDSEVIAYSTLNSDEMIDSLLGYNGTLIGDSNSIYRLLKEILPGKVSLVSYDIVLNRLTIEYGPTAEEDEETVEAADSSKQENTEAAEGKGDSAEDGENDSEEEIRLTPDQFAREWDSKTTKKIIFYNAASLFALIPNLESVQYLVEGYNLPTFTISRVNMEEFFRYPLSDIETISAWRNKVTAVTLDEMKIDNFFKEFPLAAKASRRVEEDITPATDLSKQPKDTAAERLQKQLDEQAQELPTEVQ